MEDNIKKLWHTGDIKKTDFEYTDKVCMVNKNSDDEIVISNIDGPIIPKPCSAREVFMTLRDYPIIITDCYFKQPSQFNGYEKRFLRKEIVENNFASYHTHYLDDDLLFDYDNDLVFYVESFYQKYKSNDYLEFCSRLLNGLEYGMVFDNLKLQPTINISDYGRWYFSNIKVQNNKKERTKIIDNLKKYGKIISVDLVSCEPSLFQKLSGSETIKYLIDKRIESDDKRIRTMIKDLLNIYLHAIKTPKELVWWFKNTNKDYQVLEKYLDMNIFDVYTAIDNETRNYNNQIMNDYKNNMATIEFDRRIVNPDYNYLPSDEMLKNHRKILQGHSQDAILKILFELEKRDKIKIANVLWTIYDSFTLLVEDDISKDIKEVTDKLAYNVEIKTEN